MVLFINNANCQIAGFALLTIGWILCTTSMGLDEWRVWNVYMGPPHKNAACHQFMASGILSMVASVCTSITVLWNYYSIMKEEGVAFPPLLHLPFKPDIQDIGSAIFVAALAAFLLLLSSLSFLSYKSPLVSQVHPQGSDI
ncbi:claudin-34 isoform X3 [Talpa occidentalis]|uniref:claudin-34 isoform X3 n=1 Tax=Talpa occidentalis TaxID=50954 RepID=UPI0023F9E0AE|nr:claudin-34 isoform X3 [Talpa occidentalis]